MKEKDPENLYGNLPRHLRGIAVLAVLEVLLIAGLFLLQPKRISFLLAALACAVLMGILYIAGKTMRQIPEILLEKEESEKKVVEAQLEQERQSLRALQSQINPHFLYNTLDTFRGLALESGSKELSDMIGELSMMFKYSVNYSAEVVNIYAELDYLARYIRLQQLRFPDRFTYQEDISCPQDVLLLQPCPRFVLQPVVENAISHGLKDVRKGGCITVTMEIREGDFCITVEDNGCGMGQEELEKIERRLRGAEEGETRNPGRTGGIGLGNVNRRIRMFCGEEYGLKVSSTPGTGTRVTILLPLYQEAREAYAS